MRTANASRRVRHRGATRRRMLISCAVALTLYATGCDGQSAGPAASATPKPVAVTLPTATVVVDPATYSFGAWPTAAQLPAKGAPSAWVLARSTRQLADGYTQPSGPASSCQQPAEPGQPVSGPTPEGVQEQQYYAADVNAHTQASFDETQTFYASPALARQAYALFAASFPLCAKTLGTAAPQGGGYPVRNSARRTVISATGGAWIRTTVYPANGAEARPDEYDYALIYGNILTTVVFDAPAATHSALPDSAVIGMLSQRLRAYDGLPAMPAFPVAGASELWQAWPVATDLPTASGWQWEANGISESVGDGLPGQSGSLGGLACTPAYGADDNPVVAGHQGSGYTAHAPASASASPAAAPSPSASLHAPPSQSPSTSLPPSPSPSPSARGDLLFFTSDAQAQAEYAQLVQDMATCQNRVRAEQSVAREPGDAVVAAVPVGPAPTDPQLGAVWTISGTGTATWEAGRVYGSSGTSAAKDHNVLLLVQRGPLVESLIVNIDGSIAAAYTPTADAALLSTMGTALCSFAIGC